jgi:tetratricopeptide (TPR) repeat protein
MFRRLTISGIAIAAMIAGGGGAAWVWSNHVVRAELDDAKRAMDAGLFGTARARLARLEERWPGRGEIELLLGRCEEACGRRDKALLAWSRVPRSSPEFAAAAALRGGQLINMGRYTAAEQALETARDRGSYEVDRALSRLYRFEGRTNDVRRVLRASWSRSPDPAGLLKELWLLDKSPLPVDALQRALDSAEPNDDRVWLGRANLAIVRGQFDTAAHWLDICQKRRPDDPSVWFARFELARASGEIDGLRRAAEHVPARELTAADRLALAAWLAARRGDREREQRILLDLVAQEPGDSVAFERLAALAALDGQREEAERYYRRKAVIDDAQDRCRKILLDSERLLLHAGELAQLTGLQGRRFESRAWAILDKRGPSDQGLVGINPEPKAPVSEVSTQTLAEVLNDLPVGKSPGEIPSETVPAISGGGPQFSDDARAAGLASFIFDNGQTPLHQLPETMSGGIGLIDYDGDGWLDVYAVQGGVLNSDLSAPRPDGDRLYHNNGDGTFTDVSQSSGIGALARGYGVGSAVGDIDNDGNPDLFLTRLRAYILLRNNGDGTFTDVTEAWGLAGVRDNPTSAAFADFDGDGDLDLYVCHYMMYDPERPRVCANPKGGYFYCDPSKVDPAPDHVFRNDGGRFVDVTDQSGCIDPGGRGLGVVAAHLDLDNAIDLYVANDGTANYLFHNTGRGFRFEENAHAAGVAASGEGGYQAGMGVACADFDGDGRPELVVTNFYGEGATFYQNLGGGLFTDGSASAGLRFATRYVLGFGIAGLDADNDGRTDLVISNGHVNDNRPFYAYAMPAQLFLGDGKGRLRDVSGSAGECFKLLRVGRGLAIGDLDNDGRVDVLIVAQNDRLAYFHNHTQGGHFLTIALRGTASNRDAVGARVTLEAGGRRQVLQRIGGGSYLAASDPRLHFGLGPAARAQSVEVRWPSGKVERFQNLSPDRGYLLIEGQALAEPLHGYQ